MAEFYPEEVLARSRRLYARIRDWGVPRDDVTLIGGWAVYELTDQSRAQQSRDVDLVLHSEAALRAFAAQLRDWNLAWRESGRKRFKDCHFRDDPGRDIVVDVFTAEAFGQDLFGLLAGSNVKPATGQGFIPELSYLLNDKVAVIPNRTERDARLKQLKDCLDAYNLVFHNRSTTLPSDLQRLVPAAARRAALPIAKGLSGENPRYEGLLNTLAEWLEGPSGSFRG